jgi:type III pantothenate kinase
VLLTIDVGNTETKLGCFSDGNRLAHHWRVTTEAKRTADEYGVFITQLFATASLKTSAITAVAIASVVPRLDHTLAEVCEKFFKVVPHFLHPETQALMPIKTDRPAEVGADLVAAAIGARARYGAPLIVASYGTASVFTAISAEGEYLGVAIAPGINISIDALVGRTAKLPQVAFSPPKHAIGRNTVEALQSGVIHGFVGQTEYIVAKIREELHADARVIATGGLSETIARHTKVIDIVDPFLSLTGLHLFFESCA